MTPPLSSRFDAGKLLLLVGFLVLGALGWDWPVLWPFKLLAVMGHETGHALASLIAGGAVSRVSISGNEAGECLSLIPDRFLSRVFVYSAGYLGSAVISGLLLVLTFRFELRRALLAGACGWLLLMGFLYARDPFTLAFCAGMAAAFGLGARLLPNAAVGIVNLFLASFTSLYAAMDLKDDPRCPGRSFPSRRRSRGRSPSTHARRKRGRRPGGPGNGRSAPPDVRQATATAAESARQAPATSRAR